MISRKPSPPVRGRRPIILLLCDGLTYVAGGEPMYFVDQEGRRRVVPAGPDRSADPHGEWPKSTVLAPISDYRWLSHSEAAIFGGDFSFSLEAIDERLTSRDRRWKLPLIESSVPAATETAPARIQLDALYRRLVHEAKYAGKPIRSPMEGADHPRYADFRDRIRSSVMRPWDDPRLSSFRFTLLDEALRMRFGSPELLGGVQNLGLRSDLADEIRAPLDPLDDAALAALP